MKTFFVDHVIEQYLKDGQSEDLKRVINGKILETQIKLEKDLVSYQLVGEIAVLVFKSKKLLRDHLEYISKTVAVYKEHENILEIEVGPSKGKIKDLDEIQTTFTKVLGYCIVLDACENIVF